MAENNKKALEILDFFKSDESLNLIRKTKNTL